MSSGLGGGRRLAGTPPNVGTWTFDLPLDDCCIVASGSVISFGESLAFRCSHRGLCWLSQLRWTFAVAVFSSVSDAMLYVPTIYLGINIQWLWPCWCLHAKSPVASVSSPPACLSVLLLPGGWRSLVASVWTSLRWTRQLWNGLCIFEVEFPTKLKGVLSSSLHFISQVKNF